jgi:endonuclease/exonuclease/phosphatase family metal-dependent hydrolase
MKRVPSILIGLVLLSVGSLVLVAPTAAGTTASSRHSAAKTAHITVMTRNLDEGTDFGYIVAATYGLLPFSDAVGLTYGEVVGSDVCGRAARIADEIAAAEPDIVSLQEVARWTGPVPVNCPGAASPTTIDAEAALLGRLAADGARYVVVKQQDELSSSVIAPLLPPGLSFLDRDVMLARVEPANQLTLSNVASAHYSTVLPLPLFPGVTVPILRGWISVDATVSGNTVRVISTHLESFYEPVQEAQAMELAQGPASTSLPVIVAGDLNTGPGAAQTASYEWLTSSTGGGFADTWALTNPGDPGFSDAYYTEDPSTPAAPSERIDLVLARGAEMSFGPPDYLVGAESPHPSDHAGVVATLTFK